MTEPAAPSALPAPWPREATIDLDAIAHNTSLMRRLAGTEYFIACVKANGYGHGMIPAARAALAGGADMIGVADLGEALRLRKAGIDAPVLCWLHAPGEDFLRGLDAGITLGISTFVELQAVMEAARRLACIAQVHLKFDTGLSRNGLRPEAREVVLQEAVRAERQGLIKVEGFFTHLSGASLEDDARAVDEFRDGVADARERGLDPRILHAAASAAVLRDPESHFNAVRVGLAIYGLSPLPEQFPAWQLGLRPAMTVRGQVVSVKSVPAGTRVSYDYTYKTAWATKLALVPIGYGEGVPWAAHRQAQVALGGVLCPVAGRIAMDQFVVDAGDTPVAVGDEVVLFGDIRRGAPSAEDWAAAAGSISYEIVTRIGGRLRRRFVGELADEFGLNDNGSDQDDSVYETKWRA